MWTWCVSLMILIVHSRSLSDNIVGENLPFESNSNYFPTCVDVIDIYPYPYSILTPRLSNGLYTVQVTFSRPVRLLEEVVHKSFFLTPMLTSEVEGYYADYVEQFWGNERTMIVYFKIPPGSLASS